MRKPAGAGCGRVARRYPRAQRRVASTIDLPAPACHRPCTCGRCAVPTPPRNVARRQRPLTAKRPGLVRAVHACRCSRNPKGNITASEILDISMQCCSAVLSLASIPPCTGSYGNYSSCRSSPAMRHLLDAAATARALIAPVCFASRRPHCPPDKPDCAHSWRATVPSRSRAV